MSYSVSEKSEIKVMTHLVMGLGHMGRRHAMLLKRAGQRIIGVDPSIVRGDWKPEFPRFSSLEEAPLEDVDVIWICTPTPSHAEHAERALRAGKHVVIEKPLTPTMEEGRKVLSTYRSLEKRPMVWVGCNMRFHPATRELKKAVDCDMIGRPLIYRSHFSHHLPTVRSMEDFRLPWGMRNDEEGGVILAGIHNIDLALWFNGPAKKTRALATQSGILDTVAGDMAAILILHEDGGLSEVHMDFLRIGIRHGIEITGEYGVLDWRSRGWNPERVEVMYYPAKGEPSLLYKSDLQSPDEMFAGQLALILRELSDDPPFISNLGDAVKTLEIADIARREYESLG